MGPVKNQSCQAGIVKYGFPIQMCVCDPGEKKITSDEDFTKLVGVGEGWAGVE